MRATRRTLTTDKSDEITIESTENKTMMKSRMFQASLIQLSPPFSKNPKVTIFRIASRQKIVVKIRFSTFKIFIVSLFGSYSGCSNARVTVEASIIEMINISNQKLVTSTLHARRSIFFYPKIKQDRPCSFITFLCAPILISSFENW